MGLKCNIGAVGQAECYRSGTARSEMEWNSNSCCSFSLECICQNKTSHNSSAVVPILDVQAFARVAADGSSGSRPSNKSLLWTN